MNKKNQFVKFGLRCLGFKSKQDLIENLYLKAIIDSYCRIDKSIGIENDIRDRFVFDLYHKNQITLNWVQKNILFINWERWVFKNEEDLGRADLSFAISGFEYIIECKRLKNASQKYINEGLFRFINKEYSAYETYAGIFGFVINGNIENISKSFLEKCKAGNYISNYFTQQKYTGWKHHFKTAHSRKNSTEINIYHLFFDFTQNGNKNLQ
ncbi:MAG: hypothetical protein KKA07_02780 [Bacteroidetes bacterium]|nr:hypothetical protein [Bacteroidota bacterium]